MNPFHVHQDRCSQCAGNPFDLCPIGAELHSKTAEECRAQILVIEIPKPRNSATRSTSYHQPDYRGSIFSEYSYSAPM